MPSRLASIAILALWVYAAVGLFRRDILPDLWITPPPDLRSIAAAEEDSRPTRWELSVAEDQSLRNLRPVGQAVTESKRLPDGGIELIGHVWFDSGSLLKRARFNFSRDERVDILNRMRIDPSGNLRSFRASVRAATESADLATFEGEVVGKQLVIRSKSPYSSLQGSWKFPYEPRGLVQNAIGPFDRMPGLQVGQRWVTRVVSPLTGRVEDVKVEVTGKHTIQWDNKVVTTLEVVQHMTPISARTWVRRDGLVLRQEVPLLFVRLVLERRPD